MRLHQSLQAMSNYNIYEYSQAPIIVQTQLRTGSESYIIPMGCLVFLLSRLQEKHNR
jgi:hypothetical protein